MEAFIPGSEIINGWNCHVCTLLNTNVTLACRACGLPRQNSHDYHNEPNQTLLASPQAKLAMTGSDVEPPAMWKCKRCTFVDNRPRLLHCEMCGSERDGVSLQKPQQKTIAEQATEKLKSFTNRLTRSLTESSSLLNGKPAPTTNSKDGVIPGDLRCSKCLTANKSISRSVCEKCSWLRKVGKKPSVPVFWRCEQCLSPNPDTSSKPCHKCGAEKKTVPEWSCQYCPTKNPITRIECIGCLKRKEIRNTKTPTTNEWVCKRCTLLNSTNSESCEVCMLPREETSIAKALKIKEIKNTKTPTTNERECKKCTFLNSTMNETCEVCMLPREETSIAKAPSVRDDADEQVGLSQESIGMDVLRCKEEEEAEEQRQLIVGTCRQLKSSFIDASFRPIDTSLYGPSGKPDESIAAANLTIVWKPPIQVQPSTLADIALRWTVFNNPQPTDIKQGSLGDCWLLSSLSVLTEQPYQLQNILVTKDFVAEGVYQVRLCKDGCWRILTIDDQLPCTPEGKLVYSSASRRQLWVPLIEKAMAKLHGSYDALIAGKCIEGLSTLTGAPCESIDLQAPANEAVVDADYIWARILSSRESGFLMGASCGAGNMRTDEEAYAAVGLRHRHAYSILDVQNLAGHRLLCLRNPWGHYTWKGDWSQESPLWGSLTQEQRQAMPQSTGSDGMFWMSMADVFNYFDSIDICKIRHDWMEIRLRHKLPSCAVEDPQLIDISVEVSTEVEITLFQDDERGVRSASLMDLCVMLFEGTSGHVGALVAYSKRRPRKFVSCQYVMKPGNYVIVTTAFNHWSHDDRYRQPVNCVVVLHSSKPLAAVKSTAASTVLSESLYKLAKAAGTEYKGRDNMAAYYLSEGWSGMILAVENRYVDRYLRIESRFVGSTNVVSTRNAEVTIDFLPPQHWQVVAVMTQLEHTQSYRVQHRLLHGLAAEFEVVSSGQLPELTTVNRALHLPGKLRR